MEELKKKFDEVIEIAEKKNITSIEATKFVLIIMKNIKEDGLTLKALFDTIYETLLLILQNGEGEKKDEYGTTNN